MADTMSLQREIASVIERAVESMCDLHTRVSNITTETPPTIRLRHQGRRFKITVQTDTDA